MNSTAIWIGQFGEYPIPPELATIRLANGGMPDKRYQKAYKALMKWVEAQETKASPESTVEPGRGDHG